MKPVICRLCGGEVAAPGDCPRCDVAAAPPGGDLVYNLSLAACVAVGVACGTVGVWLWMNPPAPPPAPVAVGPAPVPPVPKPAVPPVKPAPKLPVPPPQPPPPPPGMTAAEFRELLSNRWNADILDWLKEWPPVKTRLAGTELELRRVRFHNAVAGLGAERDVVFVLEGRRIIAHCETEWSVAPVSAESPDENPPPDWRPVLESLGRRRRRTVSEAELLEVLRTAPVTVFGNQYLKD